MPLEMELYMCYEQRIKSLEDMVNRLKIETWVLRQIVQQQVHLNNKISIDNKFDNVIKALAKHYANQGLESGDNKDIHDTLLEYLSNKE